MQQPPDSIPSAHSAFSFDIASFGEMDIPDYPIQFGFQVDIVPSQCPEQLVFGLATDVDPELGIQKGFVVRIDLPHGEIWDLVNNTGLIGWLEQPFALASYSEEEPLLLSIKVEVAGNALIPKVEIGGEEWLYPSLPRVPGSRLRGIAGCPADTVHPHQIFLHPALWRECPGA